MRNAVNRFGVIVVVALVWVAAETASAQRTTSTDVRSFEVVTVEGNKLVVKEASGTREYTVPEDFRFDVDGKKVAVSALKPGMKGKATFTTITTSTPVYVTEVREAEVIQSSGARCSSADAMDTNVVARRGRETRHQDHERRPAGRVHRSAQRRSPHGHHRH